MNQNNSKEAEIFGALEEMQRSMLQLNATIQQQQSQIFSLSTQQQLIQIPDSSIASGQANYQSMMRRLIDMKFSNKNFVPRDRHDIDFLARMLQDYESGLLPLKTKEAWQDKVSLLNSVGENGWPATVQKMRATVSSLVSPQKLTNIYSPQRNLRIGNGIRSGKWHDKMGHRKF